MRRNLRNGRRIRVLVLLIVATLLFASCKTDGGKMPVSTTDGISEEAVLDRSRISDFRIVCPDKYTATQQSLCSLIQETIYDVTGVSLALATDFVKEGTDFRESEYEILIGDTERPATAAAKAHTDKLNDWCIYTDDKKIAIYGGNDEALEAAVREFLKKYVDDSLRVPSDLLLTYTAEYQIKSLKIGQNSVKDYAIVCENTKAESVVALQSAIAKYVGYQLPVRKNSMNPSKEFLLDVSDSALCSNLSKQIGGTQVAYACVDGAIVFSAGKYCSDLLGLVVAFVNDVIAPATGDAEIKNTEAVTMENEKIEVATEEYMASLQVKADEKKNAILNHTTDYSSAKYVFYVSPNGSDTNDGRSPSKPWKTLEKANSAPNGSVILIECGSMWRGYFGTRSNLTYSHYGDTAKGLPIFNGSSQNYADASLWKKTEYENVWECTVKFNNVGIVAFDHDYSVGNYTAKVGKMLFDRSNLTLNQKNLDEDLEFYCNTTRSGKNVDTLYVYSVSGNPGERFHSIEIGENRSCIGMADNVVIDGVRVMYSGAIAVGSGDLKGTTVKNCVLEWIGGAKLSEDSTYGNAIQVYGSAVDCSFENNWCYQIYDCGITIQHTSAGTADVHMKNVSISDNLLEYCYWGIEYWNQKSDKHDTSFENIRIDGNFIRFTGYGWGGVANRYTWYASESIAEQSAAICCFGLTPKAKDVFIRNNVLELGYCNLIRMDYYGGEDNDHEGNTYIQYADNPLCRLYGKQYTCGKTTGYDVSERLGDKTYTVVIVESGEYEKKLLR